MKILGYIALCVICAVAVYDLFRVDPAVRAQVVGSTPVLGACASQAVTSVGIVTACFVTDPAFPGREWIVVATGSGAIAVASDDHK